MIRYPPPRPKRREIDAAIEWQRPTLADGQPELFGAAARREKNDVPEPPAEEEPLLPVWYAENADHIRLIAAASEEQALERLGEAFRAYGYLRPASEADRRLFHELGGFTPKGVYRRLG